MPISDLMETCVGVSVFMPSMAFEAEVGRESALSVFKTMEEEFETYEIEDSADERVSEIMMSVQETVEMMHGGEIDPEEAVTEIAYAFVYGFLKQQAAPCLDDIRGIVCCIVNDAVYFQFFGTDREYAEAVAYVRENLSTDQDSIQTVDIYGGKKPTIH